MFTSVEMATRDGQMNVNEACDQRIFSAVERYALCVRPVRQRQKLLLMTGIVSLGYQAPAVLSVRVNCPGSTWYGWIDKRISFKKAK